MADEFDVDAMLEAPYKVKADDGEVGCHDLLFRIFSNSGGMTWW